MLRQRDRAASVRGFDVLARGVGELIRTREAGRLRLGGGWVLLWFARGSDGSAPMVGFDCVERPRVPEVARSGHGVRR